MSVPPPPLREGKPRARARRTPPPGAVGGAREQARAGEKDPLGARRRVISSPASPPLGLRHHGQVPTPKPATRDKEGPLGIISCGCSIWQMKKPKVGVAGRHHGASPGGEGAGVQVSRPQARVLHRTKRSQNLRFLKSPFCSDNQKQHRLRG